MEDDRRWPALYWLVIGTLAAQVIAYSILTRVYQ
jgi:hypothetical protein